MRIQKEALRSRNYTTTAEISQRSSSPQGRWALVGMSRGIFTVLSLSTAKFGSFLTNYSTGYICCRRIIWSYLKYIVAGSETSEACAWGSVSFIYIAKKRALKTIGHPKPH